MPTCGLAEVSCYNQAEIEMNLIISNQTKQKTVDPSVAIMCDCIPACNSLDYNFEISRSYFDFEKTVLAQRDEYEHDE